jgi:ribonuclease BN (tRNA processing enzyme)
VIRLTVLGACGTYPAAGRACSGYLIEAAGEDRTARVWVDAGSGTLANLLRVANLPDLDAIWVSHLHVDHVSDLPVANYALRFGEWDPQPAPLPVYGPSGWAEHVRRFLATGDYGAIEDAFEVHDLSDGERIDLGPLRLEAVATEHSIETYGLRASDGERTVAYSADSGPCDGLGRLAEAADLFVCEAAWPEWPDGVDPIHMTPQLAGRWAAEAGARRLVLTHLRPGVDLDAALSRAGEAYGGRVGVAVELTTYDVTGGGRVSTTTPSGPQGGAR